MGAVVLSFVVSFQIIFASLPLFVWNGNSMVAHVDFILSLANPFIDWYLVTQFNSNNGLSPAEITVEVIFLTYITMRMWWRCITRNGGTTGVKALPTLEHLKLVSRLIPDISQQWDQLVDIWGEDASRGMCGGLFLLPFHPLTLLLFLPLHQYDKSPSASQTPTPVRSVISKTNLPDYPPPFAITFITIAPTSPRYSNSHSRYD